MSAPIVPSGRPGATRLAAFVVLLASTAWVLGALSAWPWQVAPGDTAWLRLSVRHVSAAEAGQALSADELARLPPHMRPADRARATAGRRADATLSVVVDGRRVLTRTYRPTGLRRNGPISAYEEIPLPAGRHAVEVVLTEAGAPSPAARLAREIDVASGAAPLIELEHGSWR